MAHQAACAECRLAIAEKAPAMLELLSSCLDALEEHVASNHQRRCCLICGGDGYHDSYCLIAKVKKFVEHPTTADV